VTCLFDWRNTNRSHGAFSDHFQVYVWDHSTDTCDPVYYDFVYVCNGHYTEPDLPEVEGLDLFEGNKMHSHLYRKADKFKGEIRALPSVS